MPALPRREKKKKKHQKTYTIASFCKLVDIDRDGRLVLLRILLGRHDEGGSGGSRSSGKVPGVKRGKREKAKGKKFARKARTGAK
jgi:hypothetical protein